MFIMSKFTQKSDSKVFGLGSTIPPLANVKIKAKKSASNNLDSGWPPPPSFGQYPNISRFVYGLASLTEEITLRAVYSVNIIQTKLFLLIG